MAEESILSDELVRQLIAVGQVDLLVGLPTYNHAQTVGPVAQVVRSGLLKYFPRERAAILNADGGSNDGTPELVQGASISDARNPGALRTLRTLHSISTQYPGGPSAGRALQTITAAAELLQAKACAVVAPDSTQISAEWVDQLLTPVYRKNFDLVTPVYRRHRFEGLLVSNLLYPMTRALYGWRMREPYPLEFAFSGNLASSLNSNPFWGQEAGRAGPEICITVAAMAGQQRLHQSFLGPSGRAQRPADLVAAIRHAVGTLFWTLGENSALWQAVQETQPLPDCHAEYDTTEAGARGNPEQLLQMFRSGVAELDSVLSSILQPATMEELKQLAARAENEFQYSNELWVKTVYEFAAAYQHTVISRDHILQALVPLYRGRTFTFLTENQQASQEEVEQHIEALCLTFEQLKPYLIGLWERNQGGA